MSTDVPSFPVSPPTVICPSFIGNRGAYWRLMARGALFQALTLGIYRFWLYTDMRRFLWSNTEVNGETLEYTGTAMELLLGFLMAIGILIPIYALLFLATYGNAGVLSQLSGVIGFFGLAIFGQYAAYRARRYRLTRTVFRGIRFHQSGSPVGYALRSLLWWTLIALTLGLAYPFAQASLERYKLRHTFYGDLGGRFAQSGWRLFFRGLLLWLIVVGPLVGGTVLGLALMDWEAFGQALSLGDPAKIGPELQKNEAVTSAAGLLIGAFSWSMTMAVLLFPVFQAMMLRWWISGLKFGELTVSCKLRTRSIYGAYLRYFFYVMLLVIVFSIAAVAVVLGFRQFIDIKTVSTARDIAAAGGGIVAYVALVLAVATIYQVVVKMRIWQLAVESMAISGFAVLENVKADGAAASAVGEGLADALGSGGI